MTINDVLPDSFVVDGQSIKSVPTYQHLSSNIASDGGVKDGVCSRIIKARAAFESFKKVWRSSQVQRSMKIQILNVQLVLLYGYECNRTCNQKTVETEIHERKCR